MLCRERRSWTAKEDQLLRDAVEKEDPSNPNPSKWHAIAKHVPNRTNKDCRKRWFAKMASDVVKGGWAPDEDEKLVKGIERYGTRWSLVASVVQSRNSDQCAKRWTDTLNPAIDRTTWTAEADELLVQAVNDHGKVWTKIVKTYFPGRTGLSAKNRYNSITRFSADHSRSARQRRKSPESAPYPLHRKSESISSSSSSSSDVSPAMPSMALPDISQHLFASLTDSPSSSYFFESLPGWSPAPSSTTESDFSFFDTLSVSNNMELAKTSTCSPSTSFNDTSFMSFEANMNALSSFPDDSNIIYPSPSSPRDQFASARLSESQRPNVFTSSLQDFQFPTLYDIKDLDRSLSLLESFPSQSESQSHAQWDNSSIDMRQWARPRTQSDSSFLF